MSAQGNELPPSDHNCTSSESALFIRKAALSLESISLGVLPDCQKENSLWTLRCFRIVRRTIIHFGHCYSWGREGFADAGRRHTVLTFI